jgi:hypothetical protein
MDIRGAIGRLEPGRSANRFGKASSSRGSRSNDTIAGWALLSDDSRRPPVSS